MSRIRRLFGGLGERSPILIFGLVILFWTMADSVGQYIAPILIQERGFSNTMIGFILGTSSITGALFDFLVCKIFKNTDFRRVFLVMFALCSIYPVLLWTASSLPLFLFAMAVWGIYFDLYGFGTFDFIGRYSKREDQATNFGIAQMFRSLGQVLAPLILGFVILETIDWRSFGLYWLFLAAGLIFLLVLISGHHKQHSVAEPKRKRRKHFLIEFHLWKKLGSHMMPVLFVTFYLWTLDSFFWTLSPLYAETVGLSPQFGGILLTAFVFPVLVVGWFAGTITKRFGKKRTAFVAILVGSFILSLFAFVSNPYLGVLVVLCASFFTSMALPSINSWYSGYISDVPALEGETEGLEDFAMNLAYIFGPFFAGVLADTVGMTMAFSVLGLAGFIAAIVLLLSTPKSIIIRVRQSEL